LAECLQGVRLGTDSSRLKASALSFGRRSLERNTWRLV
jgi:hypothetical protein